MTTVTAFCPECENHLRLGAKPRIGQRTVCPRCKAKLEVTNLQPLELDIRVQESKKLDRRKPATEAICPECETAIKLGSRPFEGQLVTCPGCQAELEVISLNPLELDTPTADIARWIRKRR